MDLARRERATSLDLWDAFDDLRKELERSFTSFDLPGVTGLFDRQTGPAVDLVEGDDEVLVLVDLPGMRREDIELSVKGNLLMFKGEKRGAQESKGRKLVRNETWSGNFTRMIDLPGSVDADKVEALLQDGILRVRIAKREEARKKSIQIAVK